MIEYIDEGHIYLVDGVITPSVSQVIRSVLDEYKGVSLSVLQNKANYGTLMHELVEQYENGKPVEELAEIASEEHLGSLVQYVSLRAEHPFKVKSMEQIIGNDHVCGRYDILDEEDILYDVKTNARLPKEHLEIQLGLYYWLMGIEKDKGYCIWLPKGKKAKLVEVTPITNKQCEELIRKYEEAHINTDE